MITILPIQKLCDFCEKSGVSWQYPARSFEAMPGVMGSIGEWGACETCHDLIEGGNWTALAYRSAEHVCEDRTQRDNCFAAMLKLYAKFARHRKGEAYRIDH